MKSKGGMFKQTLEKDMPGMVKPAVIHKQIVIKEKPPRAGRQPILPSQIPPKERPPIINVPESKSK